MIRNFVFVERNVYIIICITITMAKQIFISDEAYKILLAHKGEHDSFSRVILKKFKSGNVKEILKVVGKYKIDNSYLKDVRKKWKEWEKRYV